MRFDQERRAKWERGRRDRGLDPDAPFEGDPVLEFIEEMLDAGNYLDEIARSGDVPHEVTFRAMGMVKDLFLMAETVLRMRREAA